MAPHRATASSPDLAKLAETYEIESELHRSGSVVTYIAKQRDGGKRVTLTVIDAATPAERTALTHLAADARLLTGARHPHVVPVLETRWLAANRLAIVRVRIRGTTLRQAVDSVGPMPEARATEILSEVGDVLGWAQRSGVVHRSIASDSVCFQKGNGKIMVSFGLPAVLEGEGARADVLALPERCADGNTLARLGYEMLTAHHPVDASTENLRAVRSDLSPRTIEAIDAGLACRQGAGALDTRKFLTLLLGQAPAVGAAAIATAASAPVVPRTATSPVPPPQLPLGGPSVGNPTHPPQSHVAIPAPVPAPMPMPAPAPVRHAPLGHAATGIPAGTPRRRRRGGLFVASMLALLIVVGGTFYLISRDRTQDDARIASNRSGAGEEAGDVEVPNLPADPGGLTVGGAPAPRTDSAIVAPPVTVPLPSDVQPSTPAPTVPSEPAPAPAPARPQPANVCESPEAADQRACLNQRLSAHDTELNSVYQALVREVESRQGAAAVETLRQQQRAWLDDRDRRCRDAGSGAIWAPERAACLGQISEARALSLARELARVRSGI